MVGHNTTSDACDVFYKFKYDALGRQTEVRVGDTPAADAGQVLSTNVYGADRDALLNEVVYGNDDPGGTRQRVVNSYDLFNRLIGISYDNDTSPRYEYGANGAASAVRDRALGRERIVEYDLANRPVQSTLRDAVTGEELYQTALLYDKYNNVSKFKERAYGTSYQTAYTYDTENRPTSVKYMDDANKAVSYAYDGVGRIATRTVKNGTTDTAVTTYSYVPGRPGVTGSTTPLVAGIAQPGMSFAYEYDSRGNITKETRTPQGGAAQELTYSYDSLGQLTRVNDPTDTTAGATGTTWVYAYDLGGNIQSKTRYAYTTDTPDTAQQTIAYGYGDTNWKDLLTSYDGKEIEYTPPGKEGDPDYFHMGNPYQYDGWTYEWQAGRQLKSMTHRDEQGVQDKKLEFAYDAARLRIQKKYTYTDSEGGVVVETTDYTLHGKLLMHQKTTTSIDGAQQDEPYQLHFYYDAASRPSMVRVGNDEAQCKYYSYLNNLQGDVLGIIDKGQNLVISYTYDPWGKPLKARSLTAEYEQLAKQNPFRYKGYIWDEGTGLYYLRSRYYNPVWERFINKDSVLGKTGELFSHNLHAYCGNDPVSNTDPNGYARFQATYYGQGESVYRPMHGPPEPLKLPNGGSASTRVVRDLAGGASWRSIDYMTPEQAREFDDELFETDWYGFISLISGMGLAFIPIDVSVSLMIETIGMEMWAIDEQSKQVAKKVDRFADDGKGVMIITYYTSYMVNGFSGLCYYQEVYE